MYNIRTLIYPLKASFSSTGSKGATNLATRSRFSGSENFGNGRRQSALASGYPWLLAMIHFMPLTSDVEMPHSG